MITNTYRVVSDGFKFRPERLSLEKVPPKDVSARVKSNIVEYREFWESAYSKFDLNPGDKKYIESNDIFWEFGVMVLPSFSRESYLKFKEFNSAAEAEIWIKEQNKEALIEKGEFKPV